MSGDIEQFSVSTISISASQISTDDESKRQNWLVGQFYLFSSETTMHGFGLLKEGQTLRNIFWLVFIIAAIGVSIEQSRQVVAGYLDAPVSSWTYVVDPTQVMFPDVVICNQNRLNYSKLLDLGMSEQLSEAVLSLAFEGAVSSLMNLAKHKNYTELFKEYKKFRETVKLSFDQLLLEAGYSCEGMFVLCDHPSVRISGPICCLYAKLKNAKVCDAFEWQACVYEPVDVSDIVTQEATQFIARHCFHRCIEYSYSGFVNSAGLDGDVFAKKFGSRNGLDTDVNRYAVMTVYFPTINYSVLENVYNYGWERFVAAIGGTWGLWIGCSALSLIHANEFLGSGPKGSVMQFFKETSFHGLYYGYAKPKPWSYFWYITFVSCSIACLYQSFVMCRQFFDMTVETSSYLVSELSMELPDLMFCHPDRLNIRLTDNGLSTNLAKSIVQFAYPDSINILMQDLFSRTEMHSEYKKWESLHPNTSYSDLQFMSLPDCNKLLVFCVGPDTTAESSCCTNSKRYISSDGPCWRMNKLGYQTWPGEQDGFIGLIDTLKDMNYMSSLTDEIKLRIASPREPPTDEGYIMLKNLHRTTIQLNLVTEHRLLNLSSTRCYGLIDYTQQVCRGAAISETMFELCGCIDSFIGHSWFARAVLRDVFRVNVSLSEARICGPFEASVCLKRFNMDSGQLSEMNSERIRKSCLSRCVSRSITITTAQSKLSNVTFERMFSVARIRFDASGLAMLSVYYPDFNTQFVYEYNSFTPINFIGSVGGIIGLWIGASLLTFVHLIYVCISLVTKRVSTF